MPNVRSIFISDLHLGTRACQALQLLEFLKSYQAQNLYLVGDIIDFWSMKRNIHWTAAHNTIVQKILRRARHGEKVIFVPGNHDEVLRDYCEMLFGDIFVTREIIHETANGLRYLVTHGDDFDQVTRHHRWVAVLGDVGYGYLVHLNRLLSFVRRSLGIAGYWSLAGYAKSKVKGALQFIFDFEDSVIHHVRERGLDGVICGHIHWAAIKDINGLQYVNCGDWVDSCTAIVEHENGTLELVRWKGAV